MTEFNKKFSEVNITDIPTVGGKNASLGEMFQKLTQKGVKVPNGFVVTAPAYWEFLDSNNIRRPLEELMNQLDTKKFSNLAKIGKSARALVMKSVIPQEIQKGIVEEFHELQTLYDRSIQVAVRSSATAEDLPQASFAGQQESYLNIETDDELLEACLECYSSLFTNRAIKYREDNGFKHMEVALSIGVQRMVRSDIGSAGVSFTLDTETGFKDVVMINAIWGLGENIVKGTVTPDEYIVFKPSLEAGKYSVISKKLGYKEKIMVYNNPAKAGHLHLVNKTVNIDTPRSKRDQFVLTDEEIELLGKWNMIIEDHYQRPMDIEWAKDGITNELFIVQARPETVYSTGDKSYHFYTYKLKQKGKVITEGKNVGDKIASGIARILHSPLEIDKLQEGEVLVTEITNPDWDPVLEKASAIVTDRGGRTSHAAIVAREIGAVAVVGTSDATQTIKDGEPVTVSCAKGKTGIIYEGLLDWETSEIDIRDLISPEKTEVMFILADPDQAFKLSFLPNDGVGLLRLEFAISKTIKIHPMALVHFDTLKDKKAKKKIQELTRHYANKEQYFVDQLAQAVATMAAAFYPKDVIVRMSDFKTNEYANLIGGREFEPKEENPMIGWRGASRYYSSGYVEGFRLECEAMRVVRDKMGLTNVKLMIPFCRTPQEGEKVVERMAEYGLVRGQNGLEIYMMVEIPTNVLQAEEFAQVFDGFSIGSNDLTQLTMGIERDSEELADLFDASNPAVKRLISMAIEAARKSGKKIGLCGQAPSDFPEFAQFLVESGINSISFNADALFKGIENINKAEKRLMEPA